MNILNLISTDKYYLFIEFCRIQEYILKLLTYIYVKYLYLLIGLIICNFRTQPTLVTLRSYIFQHFYNGLDKFSHENFFQNFSCNSCYFGK